MLLRISTRASDELRATVQALKLMDRDLRKIIRQVTQSEMSPEWPKSLAQYTTTRLENAVLVQTARVSVSDQNVMLKSATVGRKLAGGAKPSEIARAVEFGANRETRTTYRARSRKGKSYSITRRTRRQFRPVKKNGYVVYQAAADLAPRFASLWVQTTVRQFHEAIEAGAGKQ